jgi:hypothetical protein
MSEEPAYLGMYLRVFDDFLCMSPEYTERERAADASYVIKRVASEGLAFVTKTLPELAKHLESALQSGTFLPFPKLKREHGRTTPSFLRVWFKECFDEQGALLDTAPGKAIGAIRQACYFLYKLESEYPDDLIAKTIENFLAVDAELTQCETLTREQRTLITIGSSLLFDIFRDFSPWDIFPRPGPGASASGTHKSRRYEPLCLYSKIHERYPYYRYFYVNSKHLLDRSHAYRALERRTEGSSLMRLVPKDSRGPRIICMEEQEYMFLQQGLGTAMRDWMINHPVVGRQIPFLKQEVNRNLARRASVDGSFATLDMKDASDRISKELVRLLFARLPDLRDCLLALSTNSTRLPDGRVVSTKKFAPMGSSLCFPVMSVVHYALGIAGMHLYTGKPVKALAKMLYVYGDDIIVRSEHVDTLFTVFPLFGLKFNQGKSFRKGPFRESCGFDAFKGTNVSPQRLKKRFLDSRDPSSLCSAMTMEYNLRKSGYNSVAEVLKRIVESRWGVFPNVMPGSSVLGWVVDDPSDVIGQECLKHRFHRSTWSMQVRARVIETTADCSMSGGWEQLMRAQLHTIKGSTRLDERFQQIDISWKWVPQFALQTQRVSDPGYRRLVSKLR